MNHIFARLIGAGVVFCWVAFSLPTGPRKPDLQGNWTNDTLTRLERAGEHETLTVEEASAIEGAGTRSRGAPSSSPIRVST